MTEEQMFSRRYRDYFFSDVFFLHLTVLLLTRSQGEDLLMATDRQCTYIDWLTPRVTACRRLRWRERVIRDKSCNVVIGLQPQLLKKKGRNNKKRKLRWRSRLVTRNGKRWFMRICGDGEEKRIGVTDLRSTIMMIAEEGCQGSIVDLPVDWRHSFEL